MKNVNHNAHGVERPTPMSLRKSSRRVLARFEEQNIVALSLDKAPPPWDNRECCSSRVEFARNSPLIVWRKYRVLWNSECGI